MTDKVINLRRARKKAARDVKRSETDKATATRKPTKAERAEAERVARAHAAHHLDRDA